MCLVKVRDFIICLLLLLSACSWGQTPYKWQLTDEDGLLSMTVYRVSQDQKGFIWIGTGNGICRYDGARFKKFDSSLLKDKQILTIKFDDQDRPWFNNLAGQLFYIEDEKLIQFNPQGSLTNFQVIHWKKIEGKYWIVYIDENGKKRLLHFYPDENGEKLQHLHFDFILPPDFIIFRQKDLIYFSCFSEASPRSPKILNAININTREIQLIDTDLPSFYTPIRDYDKPVRVEELRKDFVKINQLTQQLKKENKTTHFSFVKGQELTLVSKEGVYVYDLNNDQPSLKKHLFSNITLNSFFLDKENNYWISTENEGVFIIPALHFLNYNSSNSILKNDNIYSMIRYDKNDKFLVGHNNGRISVLSDGEIQKNIQLPTDGRVVVLKNYKNKIWAGTDRGLFFFNKGSDEINEVSLLTVKDVGFDKHDQLWIGTSNNVYAKPITIDDNPILSAAIKTTPSKNILSRRTYVVFRDFDDMMWMGTTQGLFKYKNEQAVAFTESNAIVPYNVSSIVQTKDSTIWVATQGSGLLGIKNDSIHFRYDLASGLASNTCKILYPDGKYIWIGTDNGLNRMSLVEKEIELVSKIDGLPSNEINTIIREDKQMWIGTPKGLCTFPIDSIKINNRTPALYIQDIKINEIDTSIHEHYQLHHTQKNIMISFVGLAYRLRGAINYKYRMIGLDSNWVSTNSNFVRFPALNSGKYCFEVNAFNEDGIGSNFPLKIGFEIATPWWKTWWFRISSFILAGLVLVGATSWWGNQKRKQEKEAQLFKDRINTLRMQALQAQMNPHFVFNALNAIQKYLTTNEQEAAMMYLSRFAKLTRTIFDHSREKKISLDKELDFLNLYLNLEKLRFKKKIDINLEVEQTLKTHIEEIKIPPLLIQPIIENSFKHGLMHKTSGGKLSIKFKRQDKFLICIIEDNGVGRAKAKELNVWRSKEHQSSGLKTTKERLSILNQATSPKEQLANVEVIDLFDNHNLPKGTKVILKINTLSKN